jgi:hypothetical protein
MRLTVEPGFSSRLVRHDAAGPPLRAIVRVDVTAIAYKTINARKPACTCGLALVRVLFGCWLLGEFASACSSLGGSEAQQLLSCMGWGELARPPRALLAVVRAQQRRGRCHPKLCL